MPRLLQALNRQPVDRTPIWIMRQAGRYLPEYRCLRKQAGSFMALCSNPQWACEVTLQPLTRYPAIDAAILFSDILTIPDAMGLGLYFTDGEGPKFRKPLRTQADIEALPTITTNKDLPYVLDAVRLILTELNNRTPLIGFSGSPWTLATYMIEETSAEKFTHIKQWLDDQPEILHLLLHKLTVAVSEYLRAQILAGVQVVQIFDTWGGILNDVNYEAFSLGYMRKIIHALQSDPQTKSIPIILFTKDSSAWLTSMADTGCHCLSVDWRTDIGLARRLIGQKVAIQGNMNPTILTSDATSIRTAVKNILDSYGQFPGHIFNLGHGITPNINPDNVQVLIDAVVELSSH